MTTNHPLDDAAHDGQPAQDTRGVSTHRAASPSWFIVFTSAFTFFLLLGSYSIMRPVRDAFAAEHVSRIHLWFTGTLIASVLAVPIFWWLVSRLPRARAIITMVGLLLGIMAVFIALFLMMPTSTVVRFAFYAWLSMYVLFVLSIYWSVMADVFPFDASTRYYGYLSVGGTCGAIAGSFTVRYASEFLSRCADDLGIDAQQATIAYLGLAGLMLLLGGILMTILLRRTTSGAVLTTGVGHRPSSSIRGMLDGLRVLRRSPYLLGIAMWIVGLTMTATLFYKAGLLVARDELAGQLERTTFFADIWLWTQCISLAFALIATRSIMRLLGVGVALAIVPLVTIGGLAALAIAPIASTIMIVEVLRKSTNYGIAKPARETLFTVVTPAEKYQSKGFIDTIVYRGSDQVAIWLLAGLADGLHLRIRTIAVMAIPICIVWCGIGFALARRQRHRAVDA